MIRPLKQIEMMHFLIFFVEGRTAWRELKRTS